MKIFETLIQKKQWPICKNRDSREHFLGQNASEITSVWLFNLRSVENPAFCSASFLHPTAKLSDLIGCRD
jgi:hypothetical protein